MYSLLGGHTSSKTTISTDRHGASVLPNRLKVTPKPRDSSKSSRSSMRTFRSGTLSPPSSFQSSNMASGLSASRTKGLSASLSGGLNSSGSPSSMAGSGWYSSRPSSPSPQHPRKSRSYDPSTPFSEFVAPRATPSYSYRPYPMKSAGSLTSMSPPGGSNIRSAPPPYQYPEIVSGSSASRFNSSSTLRSTSGASVAPPSPSHKLSRRSSFPAISSGSSDIFSSFEDSLRTPINSTTSVPLPGDDLHHLEQYISNHGSSVSARESGVCPPSPSRQSPRRSRRLSASSGTTPLSPPPTSQDPRESLSDSMYEALSISPTSASSSTATSRVRLLLRKFKGE